MTDETQKKTLEILVVEDTPLHQESAKALLAGHNVQIVETFDEAVEYLVGGSNYAPAKDKKKHYDVVLTDMFLPQGKGICQADTTNSATELHPFGYSLALMACQEGTPYVGVLSHGNHHKNPIAYALDFHQSKLKPLIQKVGESKLMISNGGGLGETYKTLDGKIGTTEEVGQKKPRMNLRGEIIEGEFIYSIPSDAEIVKNWKAALDYIINQD